VEYGTDWSEQAGPDEDARYEALARRLVALQQERDRRYAEKGRALHRKGVGGAEATFTVRDDLDEVLPKALHVGPFRPGATWQALVRFSNGSFDRAPDPAPDIRGVAIKLLDVPGPKALTGTEDPRTQDFLLIQNPNTPMAAPEDFVQLIEVASTGSQAAVPLRLLWAWGPLKGLGILRRLAADLRRSIPSFPGGRFHSGVPFRFGPTAARFALQPKRPAGPATGDGPDALREQLYATLRDGFAFDFQVQLYQDARRTPIEDNTVPWTEAAAPFHTVARLAFPPTDPDSEAFRALQERIEALSFDPWHAVEALRPLGALNRARKHAYHPSTQSRAAAPEPG